MAALNAALPFDAPGRAQLERVEFGYHYGDVSASLAQRWDFAPELVDALSSFVSPRRSRSMRTSSAACCTWRCGAWRSSARAWT
jgi:HD-like signal output (HDOD) protein